MAVRRGLRWLARDSGAQWLTSLPMGFVGTAIAAWGYYEAHD